jgi:hypothetical protein
VLLCGSGRHQLITDDLEKRRADSFGLHDEFDRFALLQQWSVIACDRRFCTDRSSFEVVDCSGEDPAGWPRADDGLLG